MRSNWPPPSVETNSGAEPTGRSTAAAEATEGLGLHRGADHDALVGEGDHVGRVLGDGVRIIAAGGDRGEEQER